MQKVSHTMRVNAEDLARWKQGAGSVGICLSEWIRAILNEAVKARDTHPEKARESIKVDNPQVEGDKSVQEWRSKNRHRQLFRMFVNQFRREPSSESDLKLV